MNTDKLEKFGFEANEFNELHGGEQYLFFFNNGYGASVIRHDFSYGSNNGLWELAVINHNKDLVYDTDITNDVIGYLNELEVMDILVNIKSLNKYGKYSESFSIVNDESEVN